jgi:DedD protein
VADRYFEIIITGRQLGGMIGAVLLCILAAFGIGVGVGALEPTPEPVRIVVVATPTPEPYVPPTATPEPPPATATPTLPPAATATAVPRATLAPTRMPAAPATAAAALGPRWVQVVVVSKADQTETVRQRLVALGYTRTQVVVQSAAGSKYRVRLGPFPSEESAARVSARLRAGGFPDAFVVKPGE